MVLDVREILRRVLAGEGDRAAVRAAVEAHRGRVEARATGDDGAEFVITLPATLRAAEDESNTRETRHR